MYEIHCLTMMHLCAKYGVTMSKDKKAVRGPNTMPYDKHPINLVTDQEHIGILYVHNTSSHDDTPLCQI